MSTHVRLYSLGARTSRRRYFPGSAFARFAKELGSDHNPQIGAAAANVTSPRGSATITVNLKGYLPNYPRAFFYALKLSLGTNEFGVSRGVTLLDIPMLTYAARDHVLCFREQGALLTTRSTT